MLLFALVVVVVAALLSVPVFLAARGARSAAKSLRENRPELERKIAEGTAAAGEKAVSGIKRMTERLEALGKRKL